MDARKIDRAVVSSASAITYRNAQSGNEEIDAEVKAPPRSADPVRRHQPDLRRLGGRPQGLPRALRHARAPPLPRLAQLQALRPGCLDLVRAAAARGLVISIPIRVEDRRQRSWLVDVPDVALDEVVGPRPGLSRGRGSSCSTATGTWGHPWDARTAACPPITSSRSPG